MKGVARATVRPRAMATGARPAYEEVAQIAAIGFVHLHGSMQHGTAGSNPPVSSKLDTSFFPWYRFRC
jgi:hypothetical protein